MRSLNWLPKVGASGFRYHSLKLLLRATVRLVVFQFTPASGANLQTTSLTVALSSNFSEWYRKPEAPTFGSQFKLRITFNVQGEVSAISAVSVTLSNGQGSSSSVTAGR